MFVVVSWLGEESVSPGTKFAGGDEVARDARSAHSPVRDSTVHACEGSGRRGLHIVLRSPASRYIKTQIPEVGTKLGDLKALFVCLVFIIHFRSL